MPLLETYASATSACISTAPIFSDDGVKVHATRKSTFLSNGNFSTWWSLFTPRNLAEASDGKDNAIRTFLWFIWLGAFLVVPCFIPATSMPTFTMFSFAAMLFVLLLPDNGTTVIPYYAHLFVAILSVKSIQAGGAWTYLPMFFIFVLMPLGDYIIGVDLINHSADIQKKLHSAMRFKVVTWSVVPVQLAVISYGCYWVTTHEVTNFEFFGMAWAVGIYAGGIGITVGHELCHKNSAFERFCGRLLMCSTSYGHFYIEHTMGHHKMVATDNDPATARCGENFYAFLPRVVFGELASAIHLENDRIHNKGLPFWHHEIPYYFGASIAMCYAFGALFGPEAKSMFLAQSAVAILLFESVNYLEHYGLERRRDAKTGEYETVKPQHSWDSPAKVTNMFLFKLQRHADHHAHAGKRFQTLQAYDSSPQLPSGYTTMIFLALFPPLWFAVMNPRLEAFRKTQKGQVWRFGPTPKAD